MGNESKQPQVELFWIKSLIFFLSYL